jgi:hypothetical protein
VQNEMPRGWMGFVYFDDGRFLPFSTSKFAHRRDLIHSWAKFICSRLRGNPQQSEFVSDICILLSLLFIYERMFKRLL